VLTGADAFGVRPVTGSLYLLELRSSASLRCSLGATPSASAP
jgi:hypothetical protein